MAGDPHQTADPNEENGGPTGQPKRPGEAAAFDPDTIDLGKTDVPSRTEQHMSITLTDIDTEKFLTMTAEEARDTIAGALRQLGIRLDSSEELGADGPRLAYAALYGAESESGEPMVVKYCCKNGRDLFVPGVSKPDEGFHMNLEELDFKTLKAAQEHGLTHVAALHAEVRLSDGILAAVVMERIDFAKEDTLFAKRHPADGSERDQSAMDAMRPEVERALGELAAIGLHLWDHQSSDVVRDRTGCIRFVDAGAFGEDAAMAENCVERLFDESDKAAG